MSRIYEALRRAESERAAASQQGAVEVSPSDSDPAVFRAVLEASPQQAAFESAVLPHLPVAALSSEELFPTPPQTAAMLSAAPADVAAVDLDNIASAAWTPAIERLPSVHQRGRTVEQFRSLRSRMQELRNASPLKSILVSSGLPQEGKSFVAANLAISLARYKISRVLLIDGDMRRSSLHKLLGCPRDCPGLTEYLSGSASLQQIMQRAKPNDEGVLPPGFGSLVFIGAGTESDKASDLSGNHRFNELIATLSPSFDWIIVDSSPLNLVADGINLSRACDGVLLIARGGVTKFATAQRAVAELKASKVLGFVLNAVEDSMVPGGYYDYDGYSHPDPKTEITSPQAAL